MFKTLLASLLLVASTALANPLLSPDFWATATPESLRQAVRGGADLNARDQDGWTPLHVAASFSQTSEVVLVLLELGADHRARDLAGSSAWDMIQANEQLQNTPAYRRLNGLRF